VEIRGDGRRRRPGDHISLALDDQEGTRSPAALIESGRSACAANCEKDGGTTSSNPLSSSGESDGTDSRTPRPVVARLHRSVLLYPDSEEDFRS